MEGVVGAVTDPVEVDRHCCLRKMELQPALVTAIVGSVLVWKWQLLYVHLWFANLAAGVVEEVEEVRQEVP